MNDLSTSNSLPLEVREYLMRGQYDAAVDLLAQLGGITHSQAKARIDDYQARLKERNLQLNIEVIKAQQEKENQQHRQQIILWSVRVTVVLLGVLMLYLMTSGGKL